MALDKSQMTGMLRTMILIREFDELAIKLRVAGKIYGAVHPYVGQEAIAAGVCAHLTTSDRVTSTHRGHGHCIAKGADIRRMMAELFGRATGYCKGKGGSMHIADFAVGHARRQRHRRRRAADRLRGGARRPARGQGRRDRVLLRRRRRRRGRVPRGAQHRLGVEAAHRLRLREQPVRRQQRGRGPAPTGRHRRPRRAVPDARPRRRRQRRAGRARADGGGGRPRPSRRGPESAGVQDVPLALPRHARRHPRGDPAVGGDRVVEGARPHRALRARGARAGRALGPEIRAMRERVATDLDEAVAFAEASPFPDPKDLLVDMFAD